MRYKKLKLCTILLISIGINGLHAQKAIIASGGNISGNGGTSCYSIGQVVYTTNSGINSSVAHGVQQAYEISVVSGIDIAKGINLICSVYPNPTTDFLILNIENDTNKCLSYTIFDIRGQLLRKEKLIENETFISLADFVTAIYFLKVMDKQKELKSFKIIKN